LAVTLICSIGFTRIIPKGLMFQSKYFSNEITSIPSSKVFDSQKKGEGGHNFSIFLATEHAANYKLCHALWGLWEPTTGQKVPYRSLGAIQDFPTGLWVPCRFLGAI
jgi:hypothetical protein